MSLINIFFTERENIGVVPLPENKSELLAEVFITADQQTPDSFFHQHFFFSSTLFFQSNWEHY